MTTPADQVARTKRRVSRNVRQAQHPERTPVVMTCKGCAHSWESFGAEGSVIKCPECRKGQRLHRHRPASPQVTALPAPALDVAPVAVPQVPAAMPDPVPVLPDTDDEHESDAQADALSDETEDDEYAPDVSRSPAIRGPAPMLPANESVSLQTRVYDAVIAAVYENRVQQVSAPRAVIRQITKLLGDVRRDLEPSIRYQVSQEAGRYSLRLWADHTDKRLGAQVYEPEAVIVPAIAEAAQKVLPALRDAARSIRAGRRPVSRGSCDYCGAVPGYSTLKLVRVTSPAFGGHERELCQAHADSELTLPGARAVAV